MKRTLKASFILFLVFQNSFAVTRNVKNESGAKQFKCDCGYPRLYQEQNTFIDSKQIDPEYPCIHLYGQELKECMSCIDSKRLIRTFYKLNDRARENYINSLSEEEFLEFLQNFNGDNKQFQEACKELPVTSEEAKEIWKTLIISKQVKEDKEAIRSVNNKATALSLITFVAAGIITGGSLPLGLIGVAGILALNNACITTDEAAIDEQFEKI